MKKLCFEEFARRASVYGFVDVNKNHLVMIGRRLKETHQQESLANEIFKRYPLLQGLRVEDKKS